MNKELKTNVYILLSMCGNDIFWFSVKIPFF